MVRIQLSSTYEYIISLENLLEAWREFAKNKRSRKDVQEFELRLMHNLISLHRDLTAKTYQHDPYEAFNISDPKPRNIHKATVRDRLLHHALHRVLYSFFDRTFSSASFSCRNGKGSHKAMNHFRALAHSTSHNHTRTLWVLKCDIRKFFASIDHHCLISILERYITDQDVLWLLRRVIDSFYTSHQSIGLPLEPVYDLCYT